MGCAVSSAHARTKVAVERVAIRAKAAGWSGDAVGLALRTAGGGMTTYVVLAFLPGSDLLAAADEQGRIGVLSPREEFEPLWDGWVDAAVLKYGYVRVRPTRIRIEDIEVLVDALNRRPGGLPS